MGTVKVKQVFLLFFPAPLSFGRVGYTPSFAIPLPLYMVWVAVYQLYEVSVSFNAAPVLLALGYLFLTLALSIG